MQEEIVEQRRENFVNFGLFGINYSTLISGLTRAGVEVNRKMMSELAISDPAGFTKLVEIAKNA